MDNRSEHSLGEIQSLNEKKIRLIKVLVQPVVVIDDGTNLEEVEHPAIAIPAEEWPTYSSERFPREMVEWEKDINSKINSENEKNK